MLVCFFFNDTATTEIYTLSLHDALPIFPPGRHPTARSFFLGRVWRRDHTSSHGAAIESRAEQRADVASRDRKSTRLNSSHANISYAVFCLKKKKEITVLHLA